MLRINTNPIGTKHNLPSFAEGGGQRWDQYTVEDTSDLPNFMPVADGVVLYLVYSGPKQPSYPQTYITMTLKMLAATGMPETKEDVFWETKRQYVPVPQASSPIPTAKGILEFRQNEEQRDPGNPDIVSE